MIDIKRTLLKNTRFGQYLPGPWVFFAILFFALAIRLVFANGLVFDESVRIATDSWSLYSFDAQGSDASGVDVVKGFLKEVRSLPSETWPVSPALGLLYTLLGVNDLVSILPTLVGSLLACFLIYSLAARLFDQATGLLAAFLWAILPLGVFLSNNLLPVLPLIAIDLIAIYLFFVASTTHSRPAYLLATILVALGFAFDWTFFLSTAVFMILFTAQQKQIPYSRILTLAVGLVTVFLILLPGNGAAAAELFSLNLLLFDNLLFLPLLIISLMFAASAKQTFSLRFLLPWLSLKAGFVLIVAPWILEKPWLNTIGFSGYWLDIITPALILISFQFARRVASFQVKRILFGISVLATLGLFILALFSSFPAELLTISRISVGVVFLCIFSFPFLWQSSKSQRNALLFGTLILFLSLAAPSIVHNYAGSYVYLADDARDVRSFITLLNEDVNLFVANEPLYERFRYLNEFQPELSLSNSHALTVALLNHHELEDLPQGSYVVTSDFFLGYAIGTIPDNWVLLSVFENFDQQRLILYHVMQIPSEGG